MRKNKFVIASAGSGKTTHLVKEALKANGNVLILSYTLSNIYAIKNKIKKYSNGFIPENITVQSWFSFLLQHGVRPFKGAVDERFFNIDINGIKFVSKKSGLRYENSNVYWGEKKHPIEFFTCNRNRIYSDKISKFMLRANEKTKGMVFDRLSRIYQNIYIDEVQDLVGFDLEILSHLFKTDIKILLVGDPRQVVYITHPTQKNPNYRNGKLEKYITDKKCDCEIDSESLCGSFRCFDGICKYSSKLYYPIMKPAYQRCSIILSKDFRKGVYLVKPQDVSYFCKSLNPLQLRYDVRRKLLFNGDSKNFGDSKGLEYDNILIYPTQKIEKWILDNNYSLSDETRSKFYVALTRARYCVGIVFDYEKLGIPNDNVLKIWPPKER